LWGLLGCWIEAGEAACLPWVGGMVMWARGVVCGQERIAGGAIPVGDAVWDEAAVSCIEEGKLFVVGEKFGGWTWL